jgi:biotin carboxylase
MTPPDGATRQPAVLVVSGGVLQLPAVDAAHDLGLAAILTDRDPHAPALQVADEAHAVDIFDVEGHVALARRLQETWDLRGVFCQGADVEVTVAGVADALGLPGIPVQAARTTKNKALMRAAFDAAGVVNPTWVEVRDVDDSEAALEVTGLPCYVKALDNSASRGTTRVESADDLRTAVRHAMANSTTGTALIEECYVGPEQSVETLFDAEGGVHRLNMVDRLFTHEGGWALELGHVNPSRLPADVQESIFDLAAEAAAACGVGFGVFKADTILTPDGPRILEVASRLSGGFDAQVTTPLATGRNFIRAAMRLAVGMPLDETDLKVSRDGYAAAWAALPAPGRVVSIDNLDEVRGLNGVHDVFLRTAPGEVVQPYIDCGARPAFVIADAETYDDAIARAQAGALTLSITTEPV